MRGMSRTCSSEARQRSSSGLAALSRRRVVIGARERLRGHHRLPNMLESQPWRSCLTLPATQKTGRRQTQATPRDLADSIIPTWANHCSQVAMFIADNPKRVPWTGTIAARSYAACSAARVMRDRRTSSIKPTISSTPMERTPSDGLPVSEVTTDTRKVPMTLA